VDGKAEEEERRVAAAAGGGEEDAGEGEVDGVTVAAASAVDKHKFKRFSKGSPLRPSRKQQAEEAASAALALRRYLVASLVSQVRASVTAGSVLGRKEPGL
jgi:hypothetical protein